MIMSLLRTNLARGGKMKEILKALDNYSNDMKIDVRDAIKRMISDIPVRCECGKVLVTRDVWDGDSCHKIAEPHECRGL